MESESRKRKYCKNNKAVVFLNQLKLLLWKNAVLKKRQPLVVALEVFIPLVIFIILVLMRSRLPAEKLPIQMPKPQPLISAGLIPVIQSLCIKEDVCKPYGVPEGSYFHDLLNEINNLHSELTMPSAREIGTLMSLMSSNLNIQNISSRELKDELANIQQFTNGLPTTAKFTVEYLTNDTFRGMMNNQWNFWRTDPFLKQMIGMQMGGHNDPSEIFFSDDKMIQLLQLSDKMPKLLDWLEALPEDTCESITDAAYNMDRLKSAALDMWFTIQPNLCENAAKLSLEDINLKRLDKLNLETHQQLMIQHWQTFLAKNMKILYTPVTNDTQKLVKKMSTGADSVKNMPAMLDDYLNVSSAFRAYIREMRPDQKPPYNVTVRDLVTFLRMEFDGEPSKHADHNHQNFWRMLDIFDRAACAMKLFLSQRDLDVFKGMPSESTAVDYMIGGESAKDNNRVLAVLVFDVDQEGRLGQHVSYKIRQLQIDTADTRFVRSIYWYPGPDTHGLNEYNYYTNGFLWVQDIVDRAIMHFQVGHAIDEPGLYVQKFPTPCYNKDLFAQVIEHGMPLFMTVSWIYSCCMLVNAIVREKETRLKESMRMMGLTRSVHWTAWFITTFIQMEVTLIMLVLLIKYGQLLPQSDPTVVFAFLTAFCMCSIFFCFLMSCLFSNGQVASAFVGILLLFLYVPFVFFHILETYNKKVIHVAVKALSCLFPVTPLGLGIKYFTIYEIQRVGIQWTNLHTSPSDGDNFSTLHAIAMMMVDCVLFAVLTWYIEAVNPGPYGIPLPWYFPFLKSYWSSDSSQSQDTEYSMTCTIFDKDGTNSLMEEELPPANVDPMLFEQDPLDLPLGVSIKNLSKKYKRSGQKIALNDLSMNMYEGQITALLGHNGAGKSTTMSILCGVQPPSSGSAKVYGEDIRFKIEHIRRDMGMCPQHNVLFDDLTVEEHLWLFANLKMHNEPRTVIQAEIERLLNDMDLPTDRDTQVRKLSSGVQRKLSVALTFIGDPRLIILDEPTSNVDPQARRAIWDLLIKYKKNHTILMSTHFMDEAQMLGDRIAMISNGVLKCVGTPIYLLNRLGAGYHLTLYKLSTGRSSVDVSEVSSFIRGYIPSAILHKQSSTELEYILPRQSVEQSSFERLLNDLPNQLRRLHLTSYGLRDTSLEEVFFKICEDLDKDALDQTDSANTTANHNEDYEHELEEKSKAVDTQHVEPSLPPPPPPHDLPPVANQDAGNTATNGSATFSANGREPPTVQVVTPRNGPNTAEGTYVHLQQQDEAAQAFDPSVRVTGCQLFFNQFLALSEKKIILTMRNPRVLATQIFFPILFMSAAMSMAVLSSYTGDLPALRLSTSQYHPFHVPRHHKNVVPVAAVVSQANLTLDDPLAPAGPLELVRTLQLDSGLGADCTLANRRAGTQADVQAPPFSSLPEFLHPEWCLARDHLKDKTTFAALNRQNASFIASYKRFLSDFPPYQGKCEEVEHVCSACNNGQLQCNNAVEETRFQWDTFSNDRILDVSNTNLETAGDEEVESLSQYSPDSIDVDDQFQLPFYYKYLRNRYGGLVFKDYVYEPGKVADLPEIFNSLFAKKQAKVYYNSKGYHSLPTFTNAANNAILRANIAKFNSSLKPQHFGITTHSQPIRNGALPSKNIIDHGNDIVVAMLAMVSLSALPASFLMLLVHERVHKMKHLQLVSGMHPVLYWTSNLLWDLVVASVPVFLNYLIIIMFDVKAYNDGHNNLALLLVMLTYIWAVIPTMYSFSFVFSEPAAAYVGLGIANLFCGVTTVIIVYMFDTVVQDDVVITRLNEILKSVFVIFPVYNVGHGFTYIAFNQFLNDFYASFGLYEKMRNPFDWEVVTRGIVFNLVEGVLAFVVVLLCEYNMFLRISVKTAEDSPAAAGCETGSVGQDVDVKAERERVRRCRDLVRIINVTKTYSSLQNGRTKSVNGVHLGVQQGEIFGLVGSNGSGKTELFKLLTIDTTPSEGSIFVDNHNSSSLKRKREIWRCIGYCPQQDALFDQMTALQHMSLYATLRGCPRRLLSRVAERAITQMDLMSNTASKMTSNYSGGMKRKLSCAIALLGDPKVVIMDDPTAGMDPRSRRFLWTLIKRLNESGRTVIFASNSMDECERLCSRLAIMVRGQFICIGSVNYLKNRHGDMYNIKCRLEDDSNGHRLAEFMRHHFPHAAVVEEHFNVITYEIAAEHLCLPTVFSLLGSNKQQLGIADYSVNQKTLEMGYMNILRREMFLMEQNKARLAAGRSPNSPSNRAKFLHGLQRDEQTGKKLATYADTAA